MKKRKSKIITLIKIAAITGISLHLANRLIQMKANKIGKLDQIQNKHKYIWKFGELAYSKKGEGSPVLLLHDIHPGASSYEWIHMEEKLAENHTVYSLDLPGCGKSDKPEITYTNFLYVQVVCEFIKEVIGEKTEVYTNGLSGAVAILAAQYHKDSISSLTMINPVDPLKLSQVPCAKEQIIKKVIETPVVGTFIYNVLNSKSNLENLFMEHYFYNPFKIDPQFMELAYEAAHKDSFHAKFMFSSLMNKYLYFNIVPALARAYFPIHIIMGIAEEGAHTAADRYQCIYKDIRVSFVSESKHFPHLENSDELIKLL